MYVGVNRNSMIRQLIIRVFPMYVGVNRIFGHDIICD